MTPQQEKEYIDEINYYFKDFLKASSYVEIGEEPGMQKIKLRAHVHAGTYSVGEIIFELQMKLYVYKKNHPEKNVEKLVVSELEITQAICDDGFCPLRGVMIRMKYVTNEMFI